MLESQEHELGKFRSLGPPKKALDCGSTWISRRLSMFERGETLCHDCGQLYVMSRQQVHGKGGFLPSRSKATTSSTLVPSALLPVMCLRSISIRSKLSLQRLHCQPSCYRIKVRLLHNKPPKPRKTVVPIYGSPSSSTSTAASTFSAPPSILQTHLPDRPRDVLRDLALLHQP